MFWFARLRLVLLLYIGFAWSSSPLRNKAVEKAISSTKSITTEPPTPHASAMKGKAAFS